MTATTRHFVRPDWIEIPGGQVTLPAGGYLPTPTTFEVEPFAIAQYPVTNQAFAAFVTSG
jgi:formylglycine-generating enzyme required for sulfatase activity